jgi:hypothetical protein
MSPKANHNLSCLFELFDVTTLGEGDLTAGANTLAAMALSIASCQRPGSGIVGEDGTRTAVGGGFIVSGALSTSLVAEQVVARLAECQQGLSEQVRAWLDQERREEASARKTGRQKEAETTTRTESFIGRQLRLAEMDRSHVADPRSTILTVRPLESGVRELREHPLIFATAGSPQGVLRLLESAHLGRPLIHVALSAAGDCERYSRVCNRVLDGGVQHDPLPVPVRGALLVTDSCGLLDAAIRSGGVDSEWLCRLPWLTDHGTGLALEPRGDRPAMAKLDRITERYRLALRQSWDRRLDFRNTEPTDLALNFREFQAAWVKHLATCESSFPGITAAMRPLAASLFYGLWMIRSAFPAAKEAMFDLGWVLSFAGVLAQRMVCARELMVHNVYRERMERLSQLLRSKLKDGPQTARVLSRRTHRLSISECEEVLDFMMEGGFAERGDDGWRLARSQSPTSPTLTPLTVDV